MAPSDTHRPRQAGLRNVSSAAETTGRTGAPSAQRRNDESWVEVTSQPSSSSSLSSIGDEIVTTGLRVGGTPYPPRRRRPHQQHTMPASFIVGHPATQGGATSSQEEYDETESEEDRVMTSSAEAVHPSANLPRHQTAVRASAVVVDIDSESDDDENATALGRPSNSPVFRPQPNAFSHPPSHLAHRHSTGSAAYHHPSHSRPPMPNRPHTHARSHRGSSHMSPAYEADNDAALRASLTTLLSCAAAARGLPKNEERRTAPGAGAGVVPSSQPMELRLVPESELMATNNPPAPPPTTPANGNGAKTARTASNSSAPSAPSSNSGRDHQQQQQQQRDSKRGLPTAAQQGRPARAAKKKRTSATLLDGDSTGADTAPFFSVISPTLLTWVVSAGVVVLVSVVGFGAGYVIGREVGRQEGGSSVAAASSSLVGSGGAAANASSAGAAAAAAGCGGELVRAGAGAGGGTLRRFRWGGVGKSVAA